MKDFNTFTNVNAKEGIPPLGGGLGRGGNKNFAFTLAEVLITLGVIGVVAAMTMPSVIQNYQKHQTANRLKHTYSLISQAIKMAEAEYGVLGNWEFKADTVEDFTQKYIEPYIKYVDKIYNFPVYINLKNTQFNDIVTQNEGIIVGYNLANGTTIIIKKRSDTKYYFYIDINGTKNKPNKLGKDLFIGGLYQDDNRGFRLSGQGGDREFLTNSDESRACIEGSSGNYCGALIMSDGWKISDDYPW